MAGILRKCNFNNNKLIVKLCNMYVKWVCGAPSYSFSIKA